MLIVSVHVRRACMRGVTESERVSRGDMCGAARVRVVADNVDVTVRVKDSAYKGRGLDRVVCIEARWENERGA